MIALLVAVFSETRARGNPRSSLAGLRSVLIITLRGRLVLWWHPPVGAVGYTEPENCPI